MDMATSVWIWVAESDLSCQEGRTELPTRQSSGRNHENQSHVYFSTYCMLLFQALSMNQRLILPTAL